MRFFGPSAQLQEENRPDTWSKIQPLSLGLLTFDFRQGQPFPTYDIQPSDKRPGMTLGIN